MDKCPTMKPKGAPEELRVGAFDYAIDWQEGNYTGSSHCYGECNFVQLRIVLNGSLPALRLAGSFAHEVAHAGWDALGYSMDDKTTYSHEDVAIFNGNFWSMFWRDNPDALRWWLSLIRLESN